MHIFLHHHHIFSIASFFLFCLYKQFLSYITKSKKSAPYIIWCRCFTVFFCKLMKIIIFPPTATVIYHMKQKVISLSHKSLSMVYTIQIYFVQKIIQQLVSVKLWSTFSFIHHKLGILATLKKWRLTLVYTKICNI